MKSLFVSKLMQHASLYIAVAISMLVYWNWFEYGIFSYSDFGYPSRIYLEDSIFPNVWQQMYDLGQPNLNLWRFPYDFLQSCLLIFGVDINSISKLLVFFPHIFLLPLGGYLYLGLFIKNKFAIFMGLLVIIFNTYILTIISPGHILINIAFIFSLFGIYYFVKFLEKFRIKDGIFGVFLLFVSGSYDFRIFYITFFFLLFYFFWQLATKALVLDLKKIFKLSITFVIMSGLNFYWILAMLKTGSLVDNPTLSRALFGDQFWSLLNAVTLHHPFWSGTTISWFTVQLTQPIFFLLPILVLVPILFKKKDPKIFFFYLISLLGIFLTKQGDAPFGFVYQWLFDNFPGFNAFREASKFYLLIILGYSVIIGYFWENVKFRAVGFFSEKIQYFTLVFFFLLLFFLNVRPYIFDEIGDLMSKRTVPNDYNKLNKFIESADETFRVISLPRASRWMTYSNLHPSMNFTNIPNSIFGPEAANLPVEDLLVNKLNFDLTHHLLDVLGVRYLVVPMRDLENDDDFYKFFGGDKYQNIVQFYTNNIDKLEWLERVNIGTTDLAIYENKSYKQPVEVFTNLVSITNNNFLDEKYDFITKTLKQDFIFTLDNKDKDSSVTTLVMNPFGDNYLIGKEYGIVTATTSKAQYDEKNDFLYISDRDRDVFVKMQGGRIIFYYDNENLTNGNKNNEQIFKRGYSELGLVYVSMFEKYLIFASGKSVFISNNENVKLGKVNGEDIKIFNIGGNVVKNPSFESGFWQDKVGDCNNYDEVPSISMSLDIDPADRIRGNTLTLSSTKHNACTSQDINLLGGGYLFSFDYKGKVGDTAGYYIGVEGNNVPAISSRVPVTNDGWSTYKRIIELPPITQKINLFLYSFETDKIRKVDIGYDNINISKINLYKIIKLKNNPLPLKFTLGELKDKNYWEYDASEKYKMINLIKNPSFEDGLWQDKVGDCNNYDKNGLLNMELNTREVFEGSKSLKLTAVRHIACTGQSVDVVAGSLYEIGFNYKGNNSGGFHLGFNSSTNGNIVKDLSVGKNDVWLEYKTVFQVPTDATTLTITLYSKATDNVSESVNYYDNFKLTEMPDLRNRFYVVNMPKEIFSRPVDVKYTAVSPSLRKVLVKSATTPFFLSFNESYHPGWKLFVYKDKQTGFLGAIENKEYSSLVDEVHHYNLYGLINAWYIDTKKYCQIEGRCKENPDGSYDIEMNVEFYPQRWLILGLSGSLFVGILTVAFLLYKLFIYCKARWLTKHD